ncbi:MAG: hypothetical protein NTV33_05360 [Coprothermobacterota bacterium]|nr:hypothetical protein [Coprothermobacterota bacterium]
MPELPDLEAILHNLIPKVTGHRIEAAQVFRPKRVFPTGEAFVAGLVGETVGEVQRQGKFTLFLLPDGGTLSIHLMLHGEMDWVPSSQAPEKATVATLRFSGDQELRFLDRAGWMRLTYHPAGGIQDCPELRLLGPDPLEAAFTPLYLQQILQSYPGTVKFALMEQRLVNGIGNAFSDEILFCARLHPTRKSRDLNAQEQDLLAKCIPDTLRWAIVQSIQGMGAGIRGEVRSYLRVHGKDGQPCTRCPGRIARLELEGRGTYFCPRCQH